WHDDHVYAVTTVITAVATTEGGKELTDRFESSGTAVEHVGWKVLDLGGGKKPPAAKKPVEGDDEGSEGELPPGLAAGQRARVLEVEAVKKRTRPPPRFTEGTLLTAMETAGKALEEKEGIGVQTPSRRQAASCPAAPVDIIIQLRHDLAGPENRT